MRSVRRKPRERPDKRGLNTKLHLIVDECGIPVADALTSGTVADSKEAPLLMEGLDAEAFWPTKPMTPMRLSPYSRKPLYKVLTPQLKTEKSLVSVISTSSRAVMSLKTSFATLSAGEVSLPVTLNFLLQSSVAIHIRCLFLYFHVHSP